MSNFTNLPRKIALAASVAVLVVTAGAIPLTAALADNGNQDWQHQNQWQNNNRDNNGDRNWDRNRDGYSHNNGYGYDQQRYYDQQQPRVYYQQQPPVYYYAPQPGPGLQINIQ